MRKPNLLKALGSGLSNLGGTIVDTITFIDRKAVSTFNSAKDKLLSRETEDSEEVEEAEDSVAKSTEEHIISLIQVLEENHKYNQDAADLSEVPSEKKPSTRRRALLTIETIGVLKKILGTETAKNLVSKGPHTYDDVETAAIQAMIKTHPQKRY